MTFFLLLVPIVLVHGGVELEAKSVPIDEKGDRVFNQLSTPETFDEIVEADAQLVATHVARSPFQLGL